MPKTGIFFLPPGNSTSAETSVSATIFNRLTVLYDPSPLPRWNLDHRLFRQTETTTDDPSRAQHPRYLQALSLSYLPGRTYVAITTTPTPSQGGVVNGTVAAPTDAATIVAIPSGPQSDEFIQLMVTRFGPLWAPRHSLQVASGLAYEIGDFQIKFGEVKQAQGGAQQTRGCIVEIAYSGGSDNDDNSADIIKEFWTSLDIPGAREYLHVGGTEQGFGNVRLWCDALRIRA